MALLAMNRFHVLCIIWLSGIYGFQSRTNKKFVFTQGRSEKFMHCSQNPTFQSYEENLILKEEELLPENKSYLDDGFVFGLAESGLERPKGKVSQVVVEGDSLETTPYQVSVVALTMTAHVFFFIHSITDVYLSTAGNTIETVSEVSMITVVSFLLADFGSGVLHWSVDNYGNGSTPVMGKIIAAFQGHHAAPWTITERGFCNNVYKLCTPFGIPTMLMINTLFDSKVTLFMTVFCAVEIMSQEFHKWSHMTKSELPEIAGFLQKIGISVSREAHAQHHIAPYDGNYCIVSGICNDFLDKSGFFRMLEHNVYKMNGVESNAWKLDPQLRERTINGQYSLVK